MNSPPSSPNAHVSLNGSTTQFQSLHTDKLQAPTGRKKKRSLANGGPPGKVMVAPSVQGRLENNCLEVQADVKDRDDGVGGDTHERGEGGRGAVVEKGSGGSGCGDGSSSSNGGGGGGGAQPLNHASQNGTLGHYEPRTKENGISVPVIGPEYGTVRRSGLLAANNSKTASKLGTVVNGGDVGRDIEGRRKSPLALAPTGSNNNNSDNNDNNSNNNNSNNNNNNGPSGAANRPINRTVATATSTSTSTSGPSSQTSDTSSSSPHAPLQRRRKRGRSLRKNVLLRTRGGYMPTSTSASGLGIIPNGNTAPAAALPSTSPATIPLHPSTTTSNEEDNLLPHSPSSDPRYPPSLGSLSTSTLWASSSVQSPSDPLADTVWWGYFILVSTWLVFTIGMGSILGVWDWAWEVGAPIPPFPTASQLYSSAEDDFPIPGYYPALAVLSMVMAWVWVVVAWVGMKYFKHAKIQPQTEDVGTRPH